MANDIVDVLKEELANHGASDFRLVTGTKHDRLYFTHGSIERFHVVSKSGADINQRTMLAVQDVRRMIGVNQGNGPGERRSKQKRLVRRPIAPPPVTLTLLPDPFEALRPLHERLTEPNQREALMSEALIEAPTPKRQPKPEPVIPTERERAWLAQQLTRGQRERFTIARVKVTPKLAAAMLEHNTNNRKVTKAQIALHVARLTNGTFVLTHQGLAFANTNKLLDGQHRLQAIVQSGIPADFMITFGAAEEEFAAIDTGRSRQAQDLVNIKGLDFAALRSSTARVLLVAETSDTRPDVQTVLKKTLEVAPDDRMTIALQIAKAMPTGIPPTPIAAGYYWIATHSPNAKRANEFFKDIPTGANLDGARLKLREWLRDKPKNQIIGSDRNLWLTAGVVLAWNAWVRNKRAFTLASNQTNKLPQPE